MQVGQLNATHRTSTGKSVTRKLRQAGQIPAVVYGQGEEPVLLAVDPAALLKSLDPEKRKNTVIALRVDGAGADKQLNVMLREVQSNPLRGDLIHADFIRVSLEKEVHATVPVVLTGKPEGTKVGGTLHQVFRAIDVACTPERIPAKIEIDVTPLGLGETIHVRDLKLGEGVRPLIDVAQTVCTVTAPRAEKAAEATEAAPAADAKAADAKAAPAKAAAAPAAKAEKKK